MAEQPSTIEGLQLWLPGESFQESHNTDALLGVMPELQAVDILFRPGEEAIYTGGNNVIYHVVREEAVQRRAAELAAQSPGTTSALAPGETIGNGELIEEARLRELHLGLGRTSLFLAHKAEDSQDFESAASDLTRIFSMLGQPIHELSSLTDTTAHDSGLVYMFVQAARRFRTLSQEDATKLSDALGRGILPFAATKKGKKTERWEGSRATNFVNRVSFSQHKLVHAKPRKAGKDRRAAKDDTYAIHYEGPERKPRARKTKAETFIFRLLRDRTANPYSVKLRRAHEAYFGDDPQPFEIHNRTKIEIAKLGVEAYLDTMKRSGNYPAGQIYEYVARGGSNPRRPILPLIIMGNLVTGRLNASAGPKTKQRELPGLGASGIPRGFQALRDFLEEKGRSKTDKDKKLLGDIVEGYLEAAFSSSEEESYETPEAPEDFVSVAEFASTHDISTGMLERVLFDFGIDAGKYTFGKYVQTGLSQQDQEVLLPFVDELKRVEKAPEGYRSVSTYAHVSGTAKPKVDELIEAHYIETGLHRFGSKVGRSLSPEAQEKLSKLLGKG